MTESEVLDACREVARGILDGRVTPHDGARQIAALAQRLDGYPVMPHVLHTFVYAESEWEERPEDANIFAEGVMLAARDLAEGKP